MFTAPLAAEPLRARVDPEELRFVMAVLPILNISPKRQPGLATNERDKNAGPGKQRRPGPAVVSSAKGDDQRHFPFFLRRSSLNFL